MALAYRGWAIHKEVVYLKFSDSYIVFGNEVSSRRRMLTSYVLPGPHPASADSRGSGASWTCRTQQVLAPHPVSVITANCGYLVQTAFFDAQLWNYTGAPDGARWMDDVWVSGQLARAGVPRMVVPFDEYQVTYNSFYPALTLDTIRLRRDGRYQRARGQNPREAANHQALGFFYSDWDVLWDVGYRIYSHALGIEYIEPRITSSFRGFRKARYTAEEHLGARYNALMSGLADPSKIGTPPRKRIAANSAAEPPEERVQ